MKGVSINLILALVLALTDKLQEVYQDREITVGELIEIAATVAKSLDLYDKVIFSQKSKEEKALNPPQGK